MPFDLITAPTTSVGDAREPVFVHPEQEAAGLARLDDYVATHGRRPNILVILMDDVGWGDFGCYGGGVARGAPTPHIDRLADGGLRLTSCYSEPSCTPSRASLMTGRLPSRHGLQRPPMYGEPGGLHDEVTVAELLSAAGYVTQCVGKWHIGENRESQPQHVGFDDFYGFLSVSDMYSEWRDPHYFPEIVYGAARSEWVRNLAFNKCFVHAERGGDVEEVEEVDIPCLSRLDDTWCRYSEQFIARMGEGGSPWFLYHNTRGAHFDNYPSERWLGASAAKHPYGDTIMELDDIVGRLVAALEDSGQLEHTVIVLSSDNGPHMENWPDAGYTPFRCAKGSTWEGGVRVPGIVSWPGMVEPGRVSDGLVSFTDLLPTALRLAGVPDAVPTDRFIDGVDQTTFLLTSGGASNRKFHYYWLLANLAAVRAGEYKFTMRSTSDDVRDAAGPGGFTGVDQHYTYPRLHNLYLDPQEEHSYLTRKLAYVDVFGTAIRNHVMTHGAHPTPTSAGPA
ncbi:MAG: arylsulfatase [Ilumatobacteraceae bacterium]